jgi:hypothetical protein
VDDADSADGHRDQDRSIGESLTWREAIVIGVQSKKSLCSNNGFPLNIPVPSIYFVDHIHLSLVVQTTLKQHV